MTDYEDHIPTWAELRDAHISKATMENSVGNTPEAVTGAEKEGVVTPGEEQQDMDCGTKDEFPAVGSDPVNKACTEGENGDEMLADDPAEEDPPAGPEKPAMKSGLTIAVEVSGGLHAAGCCEDTSPDSEEGKMVSETHEAPEPQKATASKVTHPNPHQKPIIKSEPEIPTWAELKDAHITKRNTDIDRARLGVASHNDDDPASVNAINDLNTASENQFNNYEPSELEERTEVPFEAITGEGEEFNDALEGGLERVNASKGVLNINDNPLRAEWRDGTLNNILYDKQELAKLKELLDMCARQRSTGDIND